MTNNVDAEREQLVEVLTPEGEEGELTFFLRARARHEKEKWRAIVIVYTPAGRGAFKPEKIYEYGVFCTEEEARKEADDRLRRLVAQGAFA